MRVLNEYEEVSSQRVNKSKSSFYLHNNTHLGVTIRLRRLSEIRQGNFPINYLGCPVFCGRPKISYFEEILRKIVRGISTWNNKLLSFGWRQILIKHVLQSMPLYLLTIMNPPKRVIEKIHQLFAKFIRQIVGCLEWVMLAKGGRMTGI